VYVKSIQEEFLMTVPTIIVVYWVRISTYEIENVTDGLSKYGSCEVCIRIEVDIDVDEIYDNVIDCE